MDLDAGEEAAEMGDEAAQQVEPASPTGPREAVEEHGMKAGIAEHHLEPGAHRGVALEDGLDVVAQ